MSYKSDDRTYHCVISVFFICRTSQAGNHSKSHTVAGRKGGSKACNSGKNKSKSTAIFSITSGKEPGIAYGTSCYKIASESIYKMIVPEPGYDDTQKHNADGPQQPFHVGIALQKQIWRRGQVSCVLLHGGTVQFELFVECIWQLSFTGTI